MLRFLLSLAPMFTCAFWCLALVSDYRHYNRGKKLLATFMLVASIHFFCQAAFCSYQYELTYRIDALYFFVTLSVFPLYYLYIRALTDKEELTFRSLWVFLPACLFGTAAAILYGLMTPEEADAFVHQWLYREKGIDYPFSIVARLQRINLLLLDIVFAILIFPVAYYGVKRINRYNRQIAEYYSNQEGRTVMPSKALLYTFLVTSFGSAGFNAIGRYAFADPMGMLFIASFLFTAMLFTLGLIGFRQDFTVKDFMKDEQKAAREAVTENNESTVQPDSLSRRKELESRMIYLLEEEQLFKNPDLRITDLALRLGSNRAYVSRIINQEMQTSFSDLINFYRTEHAKKLLGESQYMLTPIAEIGESAGFSSESTFFRIFKKQTGLSPKAWRSRSA
ncbi:AraC family transcriptional regulator [Parabacteroides sp. OttesenSCG-928-N08]|nr:AraC family transcriptional regulator [Parabacteroides sp. OttesenSCG-928-N08]